MRCRQTIQTQIRDQTALFHENIDYSASRSNKPTKLCHRRYLLSEHRSNLRRHITPARTRARARTDTHTHYLVEHLTNDVLRCHHESSNYSNNKILSPLYGPKYISEDKKKNRTHFFRFSLITYIYVNKTYILGHPLFFITKARIPYVL